MDKKQTNKASSKKSIKKRNIVLLFCIFFGAFGFHRFYLKQYVKGFLYLAFFWTFIPFFISIVDIIIFAIMSEEKFNLKYNADIDTNENPQISIAQEIKPKISNQTIKEEYHRDRMSLDKAVPLSKPQNEVKNQKRINKFTFEYYTLIKEFHYSLSSLVQKLQRNQILAEEIIKSNALIDKDEFIINCVLYDMVQISNILSRYKFEASSLEATGLVLSINPILPKKQTNMILEYDYHSLASNHKKEFFKTVAQQLINLGLEENPIRISIHRGDSINSDVQKLSLPALLKISNNPLFEEYATVLYRYATIISKADGVVTEIEEHLLKQIYQYTYNPIPSNETKALRVSELDEKDTLDTILKELNSLIGLDEVKSEINKLVNFIKIQKEREKEGLKTSSLSYHIVFTGNPGTGKTTVARIVAKIYKHLGILTEGHLIETDRSGLIAEYAGQTAVKVNKTVDSALNGILFIDEAYSLVGENKDDFGKEAVATLIKRMEDDRDKLVLILAGYPNEMKNFIDTNPGFQSRFNRYINFPDYSPEDLFKIFKSICDKLDYKITKEASTKLKNKFATAYANRDKSFGNGRFVRNVFEKSIEKQANRIAKEKVITKETLTTIEKEDID